MSRADAPSHRGRRAGAGFTLVEMLVTLVVVSVVSTLLWQALALTARLEQSLARMQAEGRDAPLRKAWLHMALEGLAAPPGLPQPLKGGPLRLDAVTTAPPWPGSPGPEAFGLLLQPDTEPATGTRPGAATASRDVVDATLDGGERPGSPTTPLRLWALRPATGEMFDLGPRWAGTRFEYLDAEGRWLSTWPPEGLANRPDGVQRPLPRAVRVGVGVGAARPTAPAGAEPSDSLTSYGPRRYDGAGVKPDTEAMAQALLAVPLATRNPMLTRLQAAPPDDPR